VASDAEVLVAGAGPAGAVAARTLAAAGIDTLLIDRATFPRNKPCGGGLTARAIVRFPWLRAVLDTIDVQPIARLHLEGPDGSIVDMASPDPVGFLMRRVVFDDALVREATRAGARLQEGFEIAQVETDPSGVTLRSRDGRSLRAPRVVAADGVHSVIAKRLGVNARWPPESIAIDMMEETPNATLRAERPDEVWIAYAYRGLDGYAYIFPKVNHVNVGIGCLLSHFKGEVTSRPYSLQEQFVSSLVGAGLLHGRSDRECFTPYLIPVGGPLARSWHGRVLFAGDAGGFVNAVTAEGIYYAMVVGELAGRAIATTRRDGVERAGRLYQRWWRAEVGAELRDSVWVQRYLFAKHERVNRLVRGSARLPWLADLIIDYTKGTRSYASVRRQMFLRFPATAWRLAREQAFT